MQRSEQLETRIWLAADEHTSRGLLLQKLPAHETADESRESDNPVENAWSHLVTLSSTLSREEMLMTDTDTLRHRLFWEEPLLVFEAAKPVFSCRCTRDKVSDMLRLLGEKEVTQSIQAGGGTLVVHCDFCGEAYLFHPGDITSVFADGGSDILPAKAGHSTH
jgi:molecular chaperone Hsp33